jgi:hypothetical protein
MEQIPNARMSFGLGLVTLGLLGSSLSAAVAQDAPQPIPQQLQVYPSSENRGKCPATLDTIRYPTPYQEGSFISNGLAQLSKIAGPAQFDASDRFSVTWRARLKPEYRSCIATAGLVDEDQRPMPGLLRGRFINGNVYFILDTTGFADPNDQTLVILRQNIQNGNPTWRWGGTD